LVTHFLDDLFLGRSLQALVDDQIFLII